MSPNSAAVPKRSPDLFDELCPGQRCQAFNQGVWIYRDTNHITVTRSESLADAFERAVCGAPSG